MAWSIEFDAKARKEFKKLSHETKKEIQAFINDKLATNQNPRRFGKALLHDKLGLWRYRIGKYRLICRIEKDRLVIYVIRVAKRDAVYK